MEKTKIDLQKYSSDAADCEYILIGEKELDEISTRIAAQIDKDAKKTDKKLLLIGTLTGSIHFLSDVSRKLKTPCTISLIKASSYGNGASSSGKVNIKFDDIKEDLSLYHAVIIEDIVDTGYTLTELYKYLKEKGANDLSCAVLLDKPYHRKVEVKVDYLGKEIPDEFIIGYGLDYGEKYRQLPFVGVLKKELYS